jgi:hypothetical protein
VRPGSKGPLTAEEFRAKIAKIHAEGAARVLAILRSEAYQGPPDGAPKKKRSPAAASLGRFADAQRVFRELERLARADGALAVVRLDIATPNPANAKTGSSRLALSRTKKAQRELARSRLEVTLGRTRPLPCRVHVRRVAPSSGLDPHDGLPGALKAVVDGVADALGLASDRDPRVTWTYDQRRGVPGEYAVELEVWPA